ncbi:hypothetical protein CFP56_037512 [Quercus suber]|uniref:Uncharacterized protein n=1 Tax=Quercus suber TaxID=58331 RepID=A0AAW0J4V9_QUESU
MEIFPCADFNVTPPPPTTGTRNQETIMISKHVYYFFSKLIESLQQIVVKIITLQPLDESLTRLSSNLHGVIIFLGKSKSLQKLIKLLVEKPPLIFEMISPLSQKFLELMKYRTRSLVIIKCLEVTNTLGLNV